MVKYITKRNHQRSITNYQLTLNGHQVFVIQKILDAMIRMSIGDFRDLAQLMNIYHGQKDAYFINEDNPTLLLMRQIQKNLTGHGPNSHFGVGNDKQYEDGRIACDIEQVLRQCIAKVEEHNEMSVWHRDPMKYSKQPLPKCTILTNLNNQPQETDLS